MDERSAEHVAPRPGQRRRSNGNALALLIGACTALMGLAMIAIAVFGQMGLGRIGAGVTGAGFLLLSAPLIALPFSRSLAKSLLLLVLVALAAFAGCLCFWPQAGATPSLATQAAVIVLQHCWPSVCIWHGADGWSTPARGECRRAAPPPPQAFDMLPAVSRPQHAFTRMLDWRRCHEAHEDQMPWMTAPPAR